MDTIFIILGILLVAGGVMIYFVKAGKIKDSDGDLIPDAVEDAVEEVKETVAEARARAKVVKAEVKDVVKAVKGTKRRGRKPKAKK
jgi:uncharacterized protein (UPF0333 family)